MNEEKVVGSRLFKYLMNICARVGGRSTRNDKSVAMTVVGFVVKISSEDFNVASEGSSVDGQ